MERSLGVAFISGQLGVVITKIMGGACVENSSYTILDLRDASSLSSSNRRTAIICSPGLPLLST